MSPLRGIVERAREQAALSLLQRVRWLFLLFLGLVVTTSLVTVLEMEGMAGRAEGVAAIGLLGWLGWGFYRYRRPDAALVTDALPVATMLAVGLSTGVPQAVFAPTFVSLYFRAMFGGRIEVVLNGLAYFAAYEAVVVVARGREHLFSVGSAILFVSFIAISLVMHALGRAAAEHEALMNRERALTEISKELLRARSVDRAHRVAVDGAHQLAGGGQVSSSLWEGGSTLRLMASAGPDMVDLDAVSLGAALPEMPARYLQGAPYLLGPDETRAVEEVHGHPPRFHQLLVAPLVHEGAPWGTLVLASTEPLDPALVEILGRFANEVSLAVERARLIGDLELANAELRRANRAKDDFVSTVSHELRTPLTSIRGFAMTLRHRWQELSHEEADRYLEVIERQSENQQRLVEDLLTTSRILADRLPVATEDVRVADVIADVLRSGHVPSEQIVVRCPEDTVAVVDPHHLQQIITNLLSNASKYGAPPFEIDVSVDRHDVVMRVCDHGRGVDPAFRMRMFDAFSQADAGDTRSSRGVGLGLTIVRSLVEANGGSIHYRADGPTPGACFEVRLPLSRDPLVQLGSSEGVPAK